MRRILEAVLTINMSVLSPRLLAQLGVDAEEKNALGEWLAWAIRSFTEQHEEHAPKSLLLDAGTTVLYLAYHSAKVGVPCPIITGNISSALFLSRSGFPPIYLLGGRLDQEFGSTLGTESLQQLRAILFEEKKKQGLDPVLAVLATVAFTAKDGPYARSYDLPFIPDSEERTCISEEELGKIINGLTPSISSPREGLSRHAIAKILILLGSDYLVLPITSQKLLRLRQPAWTREIRGRPIACPLVGGEIWRLRIREKKPTHVILTLPVEHHKDSMVYQTARELLEEENFKYVESLFGSQEGLREQDLFLTVLEINARKPLSSEEVRGRLKG
ncbi:MAG: hypothetical protein QXO67_04115, partial [Candidatus Bathyarchaeia archaeon]